MPQPQVLMEYDMFICRACIKELGQGTWAWRIGAWGSDNDNGQIKPREKTCTYFFCTLGHMQTIGLVAGLWSLEVEASPSCMRSCTSKRARPQVRSQRWMLRIGTAGLSDTDTAASRISQLSMVFFPVAITSVLKATHPNHRLLHPCTRFLNQNFD